MDDYHFNNISKIKKLYLIILGKIKTYNPTKIRHIKNENKIVKFLMNAFLN
jgi:hypothetical protein